MSNNSLIPGIKYPGIYSKYTCLSTNVAYSNLALQIRMVNESLTDKGISKNVLFTFAPILLQFYKPPKLGRGSFMHITQLPPSSTDRQSIPNVLEWIIQTCHSPNSKQKPFEISKELVQEIATRRAFELFGMGHQARLLGEAIYHQ